MHKYLSIFTNRRMAVTLLLGFSSGLPLPLVMGTLDAWMKSAGVKLETIGLFSLVGLPYTFKFVWSPLLDRYLPPFLGRRTGWMILSQLGLAIALGTMGFLDPSSETFLLAVMALTVAFLSATQDIVVDAYRAELLTQKEMGAGAALAVLGARLALLVAGAGALILSDRMPWSTVYLIMASLMFLGLLTARFAPAPEIEAAAPKTLTDAVVKPFQEFFSRKGAFLILCFVVFYKLGDAVAGKMTTPFLMEVGFTKTDIGTVNKGFGMIVTILGALFGGALIAKLGIRSALWSFGILQAVSNLAFILLAQVGQKYWALLLCIGVENITGGMGTAAFTAFLMALCRREFTATQYALLTSIFAITRTLAGSLTGFWVVSLGWTGFFVLSTLLAVPGLVMLWFLRKRLDDSLLNTA